MGRVLLAEDEAVSRLFLCEALAALGHECIAVCDGDAALELGLARRFDLLLLDYRLPRRRGDAVLAQLRRSAAAASHAAPAIALTAERDDAVDRSLLEAGFARVAHKPISLAALADLLDALPALLASAYWDDDAALRATGGARDIVLALRELMLAELPQQRRSVVQAIALRDATAAHDILHRLRAACGFCGAAALARRVDALDAALEGGAAVDRLAEFEAAVDALLS